MLSGKRKPGEAIISNCSRKDDMILVEALKGGAEVFECVFSDVATGNITELEECRECPDDIRRDKPFDSVQVNLAIENISMFG